MSVMKSFASSAVLKKTAGILAEERGSVLVISLLILLSLSLLGVVASTMSVTELRLASNEREFVQSFRVADAAWQIVPTTINNEHKYDNPPDVDYTNNQLTGAGGLFLGTPDRNRINNIPYSYTASFLGTRRVPGWGTDYADFVYEVEDFTYDPDNIENPRQHLRVVFSKGFPTDY